MKVIAKYDNTLTTRGKEYEVVGIDSTVLYIGEKSQGRFYMIQVKADDGQLRFFRLDQFEDDEILLRDIKLNHLNDDKLINKNNKDKQLPLSASEILDMISSKIN
jgi:hypothetical protein